MTMRFEGRRALVTGASRGIGAAIAERLAAEGADLAITARTLDHHPTLAGSLQETVTRLQRGGRVEVVVADMADADDRARIVPEAEAALDGPIDILVNNAAAAVYQPLIDFPLRRRRLIFEVNVHGPIDLAQAVLPGMVARGEGWIVNVSSGSARLSPGPPFVTAGLAATMGVYGASKAALNRFTNAFALALWESGVRINTIEPARAVMSEGAEAHIGGTIAEDQIESMETMVEATIALCDCATDRTGRVHISQDLVDELGLTVMTLDGSRPAPQ